MKPSEPEPSSPCYRHKNLQIVFGLSLISALGGTALIPAFPSIVKELNLSATEIGLLTSVYTIPGFVLIPVFGVLADRFGRRKVILPSLIIFSVAGGACALFRDFNTILVLRLFQGIGAASLVPLGAVIICDIYSGKERAEALGYNSSVINVGMAAFPALGGALAMLAWSYPFLISLAALPVGLLVFFSLTNPEPKRDSSLRDYFGNLRQTLTDLRTLALFVISCVTFLVLFGTYLTYLPILTENSFGATPVVIGLIMAVMFLAAALTASRAKYFLRFRNENGLLKTSFVLYAAALIIIPLATNIWLLLLSPIIFGAAHGINGPSRMVLLSRSSGMEQRGAVMSLNEMFLLLGMSLGPVLMGLFLALWGMASIFYAGSILSLAMLAIAAAVLK